MMRFTQWLLSGAALLTLNACATIVEGSTDTISLVTVPPVNANCTLVNKRSSFAVTLPASASVQKSRSDLNVSCADPVTGAKGAATIVSDVEPWAFGNVVLGGIIGLGVDWVTGAAYNYPPSAVVQFTPATVAQAPASGTATQPPVAPASSVSAPAVSAPASAAPVTAVPAPASVAPSQAVTSPVISPAQAPLVPLAPIPSTPAESH